jgi:4-hydroxy-2-oxoheptanedioate aldolase
MKTIKKKLADDQPVFGTFIKVGSPCMIEVLGLSGWDYVLLDMEHSPFAVERMEHMVLAAEIAGIYPIVRVAEQNASSVLHPLDKGASGILVPMVNTAQAAREIVKYAKYSPLGNRGMDIYSRAARFGYKEKSMHFKQSNDDSLLAVQIEGSEGVGNLEEILGVPGIDVIYIGPYDLSQSLGVPGQISHPLVVEKIEMISQMARDANRATGIYVDDITTAESYFRLGVRFFTVSVDIRIFAGACDDMVAKMRRIGVTTKL